MRTLLNILWVIFGGGLVIFLEYMLGALILCITIVGIPFGVQCFKIGLLGLWPFGKDIESARQGFVGAGMGCVLNVVWLVFAGIWIFISHIGLALGLAVTIIGIPFAWQHLKLAFLSLAPFGQEVRG
ncbi:MAG: YccF domain-containing protein [Myxococcaceae bacterium]